MPKRTRKPPIKPELCRQWLRRNEMDGESPPQIAQKDGYDVRTVRKQIELAKEEREAREAKSTVLRNALESHYQDLCKYAERLNSRIIEDDKPYAITLDPYMEMALQQHLPRSPIWKYLAKWEQLNRKLDGLDEDVTKRLKDELERDSRLGEVVAAGESLSIAGFIEALVFQVQAWTKGGPSLNTGNFNTGLVGDGLTAVQYGSIVLGHVKEERKVSLIKEVVTDFEVRITTWEQFENLRKSLAELEHIKRDLLEELAIITHRRVVPGKCKYCPI